MHSAHARTARRQGTLAMIDHRLRGAPAPANPYRPGTKGALWFDHGAQQARQFVQPIEDPRT